MKHRLLLLVFFSISCMHPVPGGCQNWDLSSKGAWEKSKDPVLEKTIVNGILTALKEANVSDSPPKKKSSAERREEAERNRKRIEIKDNTSNIIGYFFDDEYKDIIMSDYELRTILENKLSESDNILSYMKNNEDLRKLILSNNLLVNNVKRQLWNANEEILNYLNDPDLKRIITSDRGLNDYCEKMQMRVAIKNNPEKELSYLGDLKAEERIKNDPVLWTGYENAVSSRIINNMKAEKEVERRKLEEEKQIELAKRIEEQRIREESIRANQQAEENEAKRQHNENLSNELLAMSPDGRPITRTNDYKEGGSLISQDRNNELLEDPLVVKAKRDNRYSTGATMDRAWGDPRVKSSTELKEKENKNKGKIIAFLGFVGDLIIPSYSIENIEITAIKVEIQETSFMARTLKCIKNEGMKAATSGNKRDIEEFWNKCFLRENKQLEKEFKSNLNSQLGTSNIHRLAKWINKMNKKTNGDEEE